MHLHAAIDLCLWHMKLHNDTVAAPPESKHTPFPTSATSGRSWPVLLLLLGCQFRSSTTGGRAAALPTV